MTDILLVPGLWNSGPEHWQSYWERERTDCRRVLQKDWENSPVQRLGGCARRRSSRKQPAGGAGCAQPGLRARRALGR